ncbi:MAG: hypothetical protein IJ153_10415 [Clostridia bacterium]|nr:hypothetical protein [Clostridia bacterium]
MVSVNRVQAALRPRFGDALLRDPGFAEAVVQALSSFDPLRESLSALALRLEDVLFNAVYDRVGPGMTYPLPDGSSRRLLMSDLSAAADEALFPLFDSWAPSRESYDLLHAYWMDAGSFSAMRALYLNFDAFLPAAEKEYIQRIVRENLPPALLDSWFSRKDESF